MEYIKLGNSDLKVSRICLGCMGFGDNKSGVHKWILDYQQTKEIIKLALDKGINFFDTAPVYAEGTSEEFLGRAIQELTKRENVVIATKFFPRSREAYEKGITGQQWVQQNLEQSLKRLNTDYVDLYILHLWDYNTPIEDILEGLNNAVKSKKVRAIGISNCYAWQLQKANDIAKANGWSQFVSIQGHYNLIFREEEREMIPFCEENNVALTPYSVLASGRLVKESNETSARLESDYIAKLKYDSSKEVDEIIINRVKELAKKKGLSNTQIALGWLLNKGVHSPIIGATKIKHIEEAVSAVGIKLSEEEIAYLSDPYVPHKLVGVMGNNKKGQFFDMTLKNNKK
ncbi:aldo/keto reductase [Malacoplasma penetrans]|uniref:Oxidoreductase n=1 Tax=Malacoplasma penetrans (strain HF-2) TaxID=272633 RepID=Q8EVP7_MALP2|nr:aldo/keto reductase [Malacoplasma penetrans]RXY96505.1 aldo/keto reductase [Malacoplasma penetrans]BAC44303.1 putative oxidoreductase [Malacoplasma penetrans HF-2]